MKLKIIRPLGLEDRYAICPDNTLPESYRPNESIFDLMHCQKWLQKAYSPQYFDFRRENYMLRRPNICRFE